MFFKNIIGQDDLKHRLLQSVKEGYLPHAQLFSCREGFGGLALALAYARYLHCTNRQAGDACGVCQSCLQFSKLYHPDLHFVFPITNKKGNKEVKGKRSALVFGVVGAEIKKNPRTVGYVTTNECYNEPFYQQNQDATKNTDATTSAEEYYLPT